MKVNKLRTNLAQQLAVATENSDQHIQKTKSVVKKGDRVGHQQLNNEKTYSSFDNIFYYQKLYGENKKNNNYI